MSSDNRVRAAEAAARLPREVAAEEAYPWRLVRRRAWGLPSAALLRYDLNWANLHDDGWTCVMEDGLRERRRHAALWAVARGRVLVTGLGLGCVVRGLTVLPEVEHVDVVEVDPWIVRKFGPTVSDPRVTVHLADATRWEPPAGTVYDWAWHDLWNAAEEEHLQITHARILVRYEEYMAARHRQGAWAFPRELGRRARLLGAPGWRREQRRAA